MIDRPRAGERVLLAARCQLVAPACTVSGRLVVATGALYFDPDPPAVCTLHHFGPPKRLFPGALDPRTGAPVRAPPPPVAHRRKRWACGGVRRVLLRRYRLRDSAFELCLHSGRCFFLNFPGTAKRATHDEVEAAAQRGGGGGGGG